MRDRYGEVANRVAGELHIYDITPLNTLALTPATRAPFVGVSGAVFIFLKLTSTALNLRAGVHVAVTLSCRTSMLKTPHKTLSSAQAKLPHDQSLFPRSPRMRTRMRLTTRPEYFLLDRKVFINQQCHLLVLSASTIKHMV